MRAETRKEICDEIWARNYKRASRLERILWNLCKWAASSQRYRWSEWVNRQ